ncbi:MAG: 3-methyl-2-oxobutanoate hydroxymethyltransferase [Cardiobacteriaceae bacterium]|nr:3-methyl-2-oxobutanoate hydroxymethyltransferase [Cardiobacteriaceae bacterium]
MNANTTVKLQEKCDKGEKIIMLTCYDYCTAKNMDAAGVDVLLVGDSLGQVMLGYESPVQVTMEDMIHHCKAVARGAEKAMVLCDMPFLSVQTNTDDAIRNAGRLIQEGGAEAVKIEGSLYVADKIAAIVRAQIPVCAHIGLTPQSVLAFGGFKTQGKTLQRAREIIDDALRIEDAGAFMVVLEAIPAELAEIISDKLTIPTIGIGAGNKCDGQVLVWQDMLNMFPDYRPKFVKIFGDCGLEMQNGVKKYREEVEKGIFPAPEHSYQLAKEIVEEL